MPRKLTVGKTSKISIFQRKTGRWIVDWYDEHGKRRNPSFATLKEAEAFQKQKRADLQRHRETRFDVDDREMFSQARDLASSHGYTVLQAIQEWHRSKGSSKAMPLGDVVEKFLAAKSNRSPAYISLSLREHCVRKPFLHDQAEFETMSDLGEKIGDNNRFSRPGHAEGKDVIAGERSYRTGRKPARPGMERSWVAALGATCPALFCR